ncbi:nucleoside hydrolase [Agromyces archimandritae]|uniref:nucleoside hydrolase n=1 Tax=Agromyces archimandritae TaxID=2781962 RepID=UPI001FD0D9E3|nr:nucleoside hydrolase [Agromyces archimandritae]
MSPGGPDSGAIPVILDVDTGVDDALALLFAARHPGLDLLAVSCVSGNASLAQVTRNTLAVLHAAGADEVPVAAGAARPLIERPRPAAGAHGSDGLGGIVLPDAPRAADPLGALDLMRRTILASPRPVTLVALGPQTNLALLLRSYPEVAAGVERIVFMGGSASVGNATAVAEFNVWHDPEAAAIVVDSGVPCLMYGLDVYSEPAVPESLADALTGGDDPLGRLVGQLLQHRFTLVDGRPADYTGGLGDAGAVCAIADPDALGTARLPLRVELAGGSRGQTIVDRRTLFGEDVEHGIAESWTPVDVALTVDGPRLARGYLEALGAAVEA